MKKPLGCLSRSGLGAALVTLLVLGGVCLAWGGRPFSPGALSVRQTGQVLGGAGSHAEIGGRCAACHVAPWAREDMADRCLVCHTAIAGQLLDPGSLHGTLLVADPSPCRTCHPEHRGAQAAQTVVNAEGFPHLATGYSLVGHADSATGAPFACTDCHADDLTRFDSARCSACHAEIDAAFTQAHRATFGETCLDCHDGVDRYGAGFDHDALAFPLQGGHLATACSGCHQGARKPDDLKATPVDCLACHRADDAHAGALGQDCGQCHTPEGWEGATFDHSQTAFPLTGLHVGLACAECHVGEVYRGTAADCFSCHQSDDSHVGQLGLDCARCHTSDGWERTIFDHSQTAFPLTGRHSRIDCRECHAADVFRGTPQACAGCHDDPTYHRALFGTACADCHSADGWTPAHYDRSHAFPYGHGRPAASSCRTCHPETLAAYSCYTCHEHDPTEIDREHREEGIADLDCVRCHPAGQKEEGDD